jgi:DNA-binding winged helix-turn-helix (wHTH) protein/tetratricopeptide (TPR) repeat protein
MDAANRDGESPADNRFRAGDCVIDLSTRELLRDGEPVRVEAKVLDLIILLITHRDRAVGKREIGDVLWPSRPVTDAALSQLLRKARRALGDDGETQAMIRTVHGRGLQWVATLVADDPSGGNVPPAAVIWSGVAARRSMRRPGLFVASVVLGIAAIGVAIFAWRSTQSPIDGSLPRVAVLATDDRTGETEMSWSRQGVMALLSGLIAEPSGLETETVPQGDIPTGDSGASEADRVRRFGDAIGASHVLVSELRRLGPLYELELRLINLATGGTHRELLRGGAPAALATDGAVRIQRRLRPADSTARRGGLVVEIADPFVAEVYARGLDAQLRGDHAAAGKYFDICLDHDAQLLWPRLQLAATQSGRAEFENARDNATRVADDARSRGQNDVFVQAQRLLGSIAFQQGDLDTAQVHLDAAMGALPDDALAAQRVDLLIARAAISNESGRLAPADDDLNVALLLARRLGDRRREARVLLNRAVIDNAGGDAEAAIVHLRQGLDAARAAGDGQLEGVALLNLGGAESNAGRSALALPLLQQAVRQAQSHGNRSVDVHGQLLLSRLVDAFGDEDTARAHADAAMASGIADGNPLWQAESHAAIAGIEAGNARWPEALDHLDYALALYRQGGMVRGEAHVLGQMILIAARSGDRERAARAASEYAALARDGDATLTGPLPIHEAAVRYAGGEQAAAIATLETLLARSGDDRGPVAQTLLAELARWQLATGGEPTALHHPAWTTWWRDQPDALAIRIDLLRRAGRGDDADAEQQRLDAMRRDAMTAIERDRLQVD